MDQIYIEVLVARKHNTAAGIGKILAGIAAVLCFLGSMASIFALAGAALFGFLAYYCYLQEWVEYEYSYVSRELTVDKIMAKSRRKTVASYLLDKIEAGGMENSIRLDTFRNKNCKTIDYTSKNGQSPFVLYYEGQCKILLDADAGLMQALHNAAPSRIFLN